MSDISERLANFYHMRFVPTVKRMCDRRRLSYTLLTVGVLLVSAMSLSLLCFHTVGCLESHEQLEMAYEEYLNGTLLSSSGGTPQSAMPEMGEILAVARAETIATSALGLVIWLLLSVTAVGRIMNSVIESEAYVYGLYMIYGAGRKQLRNQLSTEFWLAGSVALLLAIPMGFGVYTLVANRAETAFPRSALWAVIPCFFLLLHVCATVLARQVLGRTCMRMLNTADTSSFTVSPRRSDLNGLSGKRGPIHSSAVAMWRMRKHFVSLSLTVAVIALLICGVLTPMGTDTTVEKPAYTLQFPNGLDSDTLEESYLDFLNSQACVTALDYGITDTAELLGTHVLLDAQQNGGTSGVFCGDRYATNAIRIACGDGDTTDELGGNATIPPEFQGISTGYELEAVPMGGATYVYPANTTPTLSLKTGDIVKLYLPQDNDDLAERVENEKDFITVRITSVVTVGSIYTPTAPAQEICPRITEDYLYLNPVDYGKFDGVTHAEAVVLDEAFPSDLFQYKDSCILAVPNGYFDGGSAPSYVTVIAPAEAVVTAFSNSLSKETLPTNDYAINHTADGTGVYFGSETEYLTDTAAVEALTSWIPEAFEKWVSLDFVDTVLHEYKVEQVIYVEGGNAPYLILPKGEEVHYSAMQNEVCGFRLGTLTEAAPRLTIIKDEAYVLTTDLTPSASLVGRTCYVGTELVPDFVKQMKAHGVALQFTEDYFTQTKTVICGSFSVGNHRFLLAEPPVYKETLVSDDYPRYVTGTGSYVLKGSSGGISILEGTENGFFGLFEEDSIGTLRADSVLVDGIYARNDMVIAPVEEALPDMTLSAGHAVYITVGSAKDCSIRVGDRISVALREDTSSLRDSILLSLQGNKRLAYLLDTFIYRYIEVTVDEVRGGGEHDTLVLASDDLSTVMGQAGIYTELDVYLSPTVSIDIYLQIHAALKKQVKRLGGSAVMTYNDQFITDAAAYNETGTAVLRAVGYASILLIPLILTAAQLVFYGKRSEEYDILRSIGRTRRELRRMFAVESGLFALVAGGLTAVLCPLGYILILFLADLLGVPAAFSGFDFSVYGVLIAVVMLSCLMSGMAVYHRQRSTEKQARGHRGQNKRIEQKNTRDAGKEVNRESTGM